MNRISKELRLGIVNLGIILPLFAFTPVFAIATASQKESPFCTNLPTTISKVNTSLANLKSKLTAARGQRDQQLTANWAKWDQEISADRAKWDQERQQDFTKLEAKAKTDSQKTAVKTYETAIIEAVNARRAANDVARQTYRTGVDSAITVQRSTIDSQISIFTGSVNNAASTAQASCQATPTQGPTIRAAFQASMKSARETYSANRKNDSNVSAQLKQLAQTRDASFATNDSAFDASAKLARSALKAAFGNSSI